MTGPSTVPGNVVGGLGDGGILVSPSVGEAPRCLAACRRNPKMLRPVMATEMARMLIVAGLMVMSPASKKLVTKKRLVMTVGTVTVPEKVVARATRLLTIPR